MDVLSNDLKINNHKEEEYDKESDKNYTTYPEAKRSDVGFQAQINTSDSWPLKIVARLLGISMLASTSILSEWLAVKQSAWNKTAKYLKIK